MLRLIMHPKGVVANDLPKSLYRKEGVAPAVTGRHRVSAVSLVLSGVSRIAGYSVFTAH